MNPKDHYHIDEAEWKKSFSNTLQHLIYPPNHLEEKTSVNKVAAAINADPKSIRNYLECKSVPTAIMIVKLAAYFDVSIDYLLTGEKADTQYSERTILALATLIKNFDITLTKEDDDGIALHIKDDVLSLILKELYYSKNSDSFTSSVENLTLAYGNMKIYHQNLISPSTFYELIRHEYIYHDLEEYIISCTNPDYGDCFGMDPYTFEEVERRMKEWDEMTIEDKNKWWETYSSTKKEEK